MLSSEYSRRVPSGDQPRRRLTAHAVGEQLVGAVPVRSDDPQRGVGQVAVFRDEQLRALSTLRMKAIERAGPQVRGRRRRLGRGSPVGDGEPGATAASDGTGVTTGVTRSKPGTGGQRAADDDQERRQRAA